MSDALNNLDNNPAIGGSGFGGSYTGQVYLGTKKVPGFTTQSPTGGTYTVKPRKGEKIVSAAEAKRSYLTDDKLRSSWLQTLKKNGIDTDPIKARALWDLSVDGASDWFATSNGTQKVTPEQYLGWYTGGQKKAAPKPDLSRSIYEYAPEQIDADVDEIAQKRLGRTINEEDRAADWYKNLVTAISDMAAKGTISKVEDVRNPKTGKLERVTRQIPKFTKEKATAAIEKAVTAADPEAVERMARLNFAKRYGIGG
jgi:hypothetical protein